MSIPNIVIVYATEIILLDIAIPSLNGLVRAENRERFNAFLATDEADLKVNCYNTDSKLNLSDRVVA